MLIRYFMCLSSSEQYCSFMYYMKAETLAWRKTGNTASHHESSLSFCNYLNYCQIQGNLRNFEGEILANKKAGATQWEAQQIRFPSCLSAGVRIVKYVDRINQTRLHVSGRPLGACTRFIRPVQFVPCQEEHVSPARDTGCFKKCPGSVTCQENNYSSLIQVFRIGNRMHQEQEQALPARALKS